MLVPPRAGSAPIMNASRISRASRRAACILVSGVALVHPAGRFVPRHALKAVWRAVKSAARVVEVSSGRPNAASRLPWVVKLAGVTPFAGGHRVVRSGGAQLAFMRSAAV